MMILQALKTLELDKKLEIMFYMVGLVTMSSFCIYHFIYQSAVIGSLLIVIMAAIIISIKKLIDRNENTIYKFIIVCFLSSTLIITCYMYGARGLIIVFPMITCSWIILNFKNAVIANILLIILSLAASTNSLETYYVLKFAVGLSLTFIFSAAFSYIVSKQNESLEKDANEDYLTGIMNRRSFSKWLELLISRNSHEKKIISLFYIDIDNFKNVNDVYGNTVGDKVLTEFSKRIISLVRQNELIINNNKLMSFARLGGDEFVLTILDSKDNYTAEAIAKRFIEEMVNEYFIDEHTIKLTISIGILIHHEGDTSCSELIKHAAAAMLQAKLKGKNQYFFFNEDIYNELSKAKEIEEEIIKSLNNHDFYLVFMPIYKCNTALIAGAEILIRTNSEQLSKVGPDTFIPIAENKGLIFDIDLWVIENTFIKIQSILCNNELGDIWFAINISSLELQNKYFPNKVNDLLKKYDIPPSLIELEITETSLVSHDELSISILHKLKETGVSLSLDDFGTGYTAFNQLMNYPVDNLKIDRSFVSAIDSINTGSSSMVEIIMKIAALYDMNVVAEGVETADQFEYLNTLGCDFAQGYFLSKPISWTSLIDNIIKQSPTNSKKIMYESTVEINEQLIPIY